MRLTVLLLLAVLSSTSFATSELDSEINSFQVHLMNKKKYQQYKKAGVPIPTRPTMVSQAFAEPAKPAQTTQPAQVETPATYYVTSRPAPRNSDSFLQRLTLLPSVSFSSFDGADDYVVLPQGLSKAINTGFSGQLNTDLNLFSDPHFFAEVGLAYLSVGSYTGIAALNQFDQLGLNYFGINLDAKYVFSGQNSSSFYIKGGGTPMFLSGQNYSNLNSASPFMIVQRFGTINSFDVAINLGLGYRYNFNHDFSVVLEATGYQGFMPVTSYYNIYNAILTTSLGVSYQL